MGAFPGLESHQPSALRSEFGAHSVVHPDLGSTKCLGGWEGPTQSALPAQAGERRHSPAASRGLCGDVRDSACGLERIQPKAEITPPWRRGRGDGGEAGKRAQRAGEGSAAAQSLHS